METAQSDQDLVLTNQLQWQGKPTVPLSAALHFADKIADYELESAEELNHD